MDLGSVITALIEKPQNWLLIAALALMWPILTWAGELVARLVGESMKLPEDEMRFVLPQAVYFILLLHFFLGVCSALWFWYFTELPSPLILNKTAPAPLMSARAEGYFIAGVATAMVLMGLLTAHEDRQPFALFMGWMSPIFALFGVIGAIAFVYTGALDDPRMPSSEAFSNSVEHWVWKYGLVSFASITVSMTAYLAYGLLWALWRLSGVFVRK